MKGILFTFLILGSSIYSCFAQKWNNDDKAIYTEVLHTLKIRNLYTKKYDIDSNLFLNVFYYTNKTAAIPPLVKFINDGDWKFVTNYKSFQNGSRKVYSTKKLIPDARINEKEGFNSLSPIIYSEDNLRAIVIFQTFRHNDMDKTGFLFLNKIDNQWKISKEIDTTQIIN